MAEELPFADSSADLVTAMSAFHWFDRPRFLQEAHRVLKPQGCLALLNYTINMELSYPGCCKDTVNQVCEEVKTENLTKSTTQTRLLNLSKDTILNNCSSGNVFFFALMFWFLHGSDRKGVLWVPVKALLWFFIVKPDFHFSIASTQTSDFWYCFVFTIFRN